MKKIVLIIFIIFLFFLVVRIFSGEDTWLCDKKTGEWIKHGNPKGEAPKKKCERASPFSLEEKVQIEKYIRDNISTLSPTKEVLGGKFYITKFVWQRNNSLIVEYEDGHIALKASLKPIFLKDEISIETFDILEK